MATTSGAASSTSALSSDCSTGALTYTHSSQLISCTTFTGTIVVPTGVGDFSPENTMASDVLETLIGDIQISGSSNLRSIQMSKLKNVTGAVTIQNNSNLTNINLAAQSVQSAISVLENGDQMSVSFPNLQSAGSLSFNGLSRLSTPVLGSTGKLSIFNSPELMSVIADSLAKIVNGEDEDAFPGTADLGIVNNTGLTTVSFASLVEVDNLVFTGNTALKDVDLTSLQKTRGDLKITSGDFGSFALNNLTSVGATLDIESDQDISSLCGSINTRNHHSLVVNTIICNSTASSPSDSSSSGSSLSTGAKAGIGVGVAIGVLLLLGLAYFFLTATKKKKKESVRSEETPVRVSSEHEMSVYERFETPRHELHDEQRPNEIGGQNAYELGGYYGSELAGDHEHERMEHMIRIGHNK